MANDIWSNIYSPMQITPVCKIKENISVLTGGIWEHYRVDFIEGMPPGPGNTRDIIAMAGVGVIAANATLAKRVVDILQLNDLEFLHLRWRPVDPVEGVLWERAGKARWETRAMLSRVDQTTVNDDPNLSTTTFWIVGRDRDMNLEVRNPLAVALPAARFLFWGFRYALTKLPQTQVSGADDLALRQGDQDAVRRLIGMTTWLPAEGYSGG